MLALRYRHLKALQRRHGDVRISVTEFSLLFGQTRDSVADDRAAAHPVLHGVAHQTARSVHR